MTIALEAPLCMLFTRDPKWLKPMFLANLATNPLLNGLIGAVAGIKAPIPIVCLLFGEAFVILAEAWVYASFGMGAKRALALSAFLNSIGAAISIVQWVASGAY